MSKDEKSGFNDERVKFIQSVVSASIKSGTDSSKWEKFWSNADAVDG